MPRQIISEHRLIARLNEELSKGENCQAHTVSAVMRMDDPDTMGCNWTIAAMSCFGSFLSDGNREAEQVIERLQGLYNLNEGAVLSRIDFGDTPNTGASA